MYWMLATWRQRWREPHAQLIYATGRNIAPLRHSFPNFIKLRTAYLKNLNTLPFLQAYPWVIIPITQNSTLYSCVIEPNREVKPSVPCRRFAACKISLNVAWKSTFRQNYRTTFSPTVTTSAAGISHVVADVEAPGGEKWERLKSGGKQWQATPKNLPRMQRTRAIPVDWLSSGLCPDRPKGWIPIIIRA